MKILFCYQPITLVSFIGVAPFICEYLFGKLLGNYLAKDIIDESQQIKNPPGINTGRIINIVKLAPILSF